MRCVTVFEKEDIFETIAIEISASYLNELLPHSGRLLDTKSVSLCSSDEQSPVIDSVLICAHGFRTIWTKLRKQ